MDAILQTNVLKLNKQAFPKLQTTKCTSVVLQIAIILQQQ